MKVGDEVLLKSKKECMKIDEAMDTKLGSNSEMDKTFGKKVMIKKIDIQDNTFLVTGGNDGVYSIDWIEGDETYVIFKLDDSYSEPTKMYLKATELAIDVMERIRVENPQFWELLISTGSRDNFFKEILNSPEKVWYKETFDFKTAGFSHYFSWERSLLGRAYWVEIFENNELNKPLIYHFTDTNINFSQICNDIINDNKVTFCVEGKNLIYVGWLQQGGISISEGSFLKKLDGFPLEIREINKSCKDSWVTSLQEYATLYDRNKKQTNTYIKDRERRKVKNRFEVTTF